MTFLDYIALRETGMGKEMDDLDPEVVARISPPGQQNQAREIAKKVKNTAKQGVPINKVVKAQQFVNLLNQQKLS